MAKGEGKGEGKGDGKGMAKGHGKGDGDELALEAVCCLGALFIYCGWSCCCCIAENITGKVSLRRLHRSVRLRQPTELLGCRRWVWVAKGSSGGSCLPDDWVMFPAPTWIARG